MDLIRRLHQAIQKNDKTGIQAAVAAGADMDYIWGMQGTALCQAISTRSFDNVALLLELGCDVNAEDFDGGYPLSLAIRKHLPDIALLLISVPSCDINVLDPVSKQRPLCAVVMEGLSGIVEVLVQDERCDITQGNSVGNSALHLALLHKQDSIIQILARCEGFRFLQNLAGCAPVHIVATLGHCDSLDILYPAPSKKGEVFHEMGIKGDSHTSTALYRELNQRVMYTGDTALHLAVREKHSDMAERLIALGAAVDVQNNSGQTVLLLACVHQDSSLAVTLIKSGAPPNLAGHLHLQQHTLLATHARESSLTPLHVAASTNNIELVKTLCQFGADVNMCDERGRSALHLALLNGAGEVAMYLLNQTEQSLHTSFGGNSLLHVVSQCYNHAADITTAILKRGGSLNEPNRQNNLPLHEAVCWENVDVVRVLLEHGANPSASGELNTVPLIFAARTGNVKIAALLLSAGADINGDKAQRVDDWDSSTNSDKEEWTPLREALHAGMVDFVRYLVEAGCNLSNEKYLFTQYPLSALNTFGASSLININDLDVSSDEDDYDDGDIPDVVKGNLELLKWLQARACNPQTLMQLSLETVRGVFRKVDPPFALMMALPLPEKIIAKLFYRAEF